MDNADFVTLAQQNGINAAGLSDSNKLIDLLYNFDKTEWAKFTEIFPNLNEYVAKALPSIEKANYFLGMDLATGTCTAAVAWCFNSYSCRSYSVA